MVTITGSSKIALLQSDDIYEKCESDAAGKADTVELSAPITPGMAHCFLGVQMFNSSGTLIVDSAGTFTVTVKTVNTEQWEAVTGGVIDATAPVTLNFAANVSAIKVVPASLSATVTYRVVVTGNGA